MILIMCCAFSLCVIYGSVFGVFAGFFIDVLYFLVLKRQFNRGTSILLQFIGVNLTFAPMHILGWPACREEYRLS